MFKTTCVCRPQRRVAFLDHPVYGDDRGSVAGGWIVQGYENTDERVGQHSRTRMVERWQ